ncbi:hypothetical protein AYO21_02204 [Fonsecaea monophora]|uniref:Enoyl reductase (ER) domain-containing protein n=1 Tax=Fonsecaea monophora TaxID=254056 RepID=A0A177FH95_9EURO|nr:hypothetical protein AYO21_02204 [Fonsecaea monophora]KAH0844038.1 zinc-binding oxidoreductase [Fonsecaea pedrosoi]OAG43618.1 hypothetical protein AYO21_02204 [Fonsecaea monophora]
MKAVIWTGDRAELVTDRPHPRLRPDYLLVSCVSIGLNPTDAKSIATRRAALNGLLGSDFAGVVLEVGAEVTKPFAKGDRVCGFAHGANFNEAEDGAWAEIIAVKGDCCMKVPETWGFDEAATIAASAITAGQGLFQEMGLRLPAVDGETEGLPAGAGTGVGEEGEKEYILIYGGSTSAGTLAIQFLTLAGYTVLATCSPRNFDLCKSRGAEAVFDYRDPTCGQKIHAYTSGQLKLVWDTIGSDDGVGICMAALSRDPHADKKYGTILFNNIPRTDVKHSFSVLVTFAGEAFDKFGKHFPASRRNFEFAKMFTTLVEGLMAKGRLMPHPVRLIGAGLVGMLEEGVPMMDSGEVSGFKVVARIADTPS